MGNRRKYIINRSLPAKIALKLAQEEGLTLKDLLNARNISVSGTLNPGQYDSYGPIKIKIIAPEFDLSRLEIFLSNFPVECAIEIWKLIEPEVNKLRKPEMRTFKILSIKNTASKIYALVSALSKKSLRERPDYFQKLVEHVNSFEHKEYFFKQNGKLDLLALTAYCTEKFCGLSPFNDLENFRITYIQPFLKVYKEDIKRHFDEVLRDPARTTWAFLIEDIIRLCNSKPPLTSQ